MGELGSCGLKSMPGCDSVEGPQGQAVGVCGFMVVGATRNGLAETGFLGLASPKWGHGECPKPKCQSFLHEKVGFCE